MASSAVAVGGDVDRCADVAAEVVCFFAVAVSAGAGEEKGLVPATGVVAPDLHCCWGFVGRAGGMVLGCSYVLWSSEEATQAIST